MTKSMITETPGTGSMTPVELLVELEPVAEANLNRHLGLAKEWHPHDYVPWDEGRNFAAMGGIDWEQDQSRLSPVARAAMVTNLLTEDNLPSYHRLISHAFSRDRAWGAWVDRWTAEENRHGITIRDYLIVTRAVDPVALERARMICLSQGIDDPTGTGDNTILHGVAYVTFQELATRVSHRNTGKACHEPRADRMLTRIAADENLHMVFYRNICAAALDLVPDDALAAVAAVVENFRMPGAGMPEFRRNSVLIAKYGIYDLRQHLDEVVMPVLRHWNIFDRTDYSGRGERIRDDLAAYLERLGNDVLRFEEQRDRALAREAARRGE
ncbi:acyl-ACP desaturase [Nocardia sp. NPDC005825]|uniref:acyl-ACP desaturase n=1 Tax=unclassified Nocardia TaxID=2637762 RepID=UPI0033CA0317